MLDTPENSELDHAKRGGKFIGGNGIHVGEWSTLVVNEDGTKIAVLEATQSGGAAVSILAEMGLDTVDPGYGMIINAGRGRVITKVQFTTGSVFAQNNNIL